MKNYSAVITALIALLLAISLVVIDFGHEPELQAFPQPPHAFWGIVLIGGFPSGADVELETCIKLAGPFLDVDTNEPLTPVTKELQFGWNLVAPHAQSAENFEVVFSNALNPIKLTSNAITFSRELNASLTHSGIAAEIVEQFLTVNEGETIEPNISNWVFITDTGNSADLPIIVPQ